MKAALGRIAPAVGLAIALHACRPEEKAPAPRACCEQPQPAAGVTPFLVVADEVVGQSDEQKVKLRAGLSQPIKREGVYPVLHTLYRHAMKRTAFEPLDFVAELYANEGDARTGSEAQMLARISRTQTELAPKCDNRVRFDFSELVANAFAASQGRGQEEDMNDTCHLAQRKNRGRVDENFTHKPAFKVDPARQAVAVTSPYLEMGKDEYVTNLRLNSALSDWIDQVTGFFRRVEELKEIAYIGLLDDQPVVNITVTRAQFESGLAGLQEEIAAHAAVTFQTLGMKKNSDKAAEKEQETFKSKTYKAALATLPKSQVTISPQLK